MRGKAQLRQGKERRHRPEKKQNQLYSQMTGLCMEKTPKSEQFLELTSKFSKSAGYKIQNSTAFLC